MEGIVSDCGRITSETFYYRLNCRDWGWPRAIAARLISETFGPSIVMILRAGGRRAANRENFRRVESSNTDGSRGDTRCRDGLVE